MTGYLLGIDIGGTFTDIAVKATGSVGATGLKTLTTPADPVSGVVKGVRSLLERSAIAPRDVTRVVHATTLATNSILTGNGPKVAFIATEGFKDIPRIGRELRAGAERFDLFYEKPMPPVADDLLFEIRERIDARGRVVIPLDRAQTLQTLRDVADRKPSSVAVCLLHSYANPAHEQELARLLRRLVPTAYIALSSAVWPEFREYDRALTTIMSAYVGPILARYLKRLSEQLHDLGIVAPLQVMQSNGGITDVGGMLERAIFCIESGPAAGVIAAAHVAAKEGISDLVSFDMGGTTAKAGLVVAAQPVLTHDFRVGVGNRASSRDATSGFPIRVPVVDLAEVGAGGGSIAWVDDGHLLHVGPHSAGADPGPACYGLGGTQPTVTDADVVLGYIGSDSLFGREIAISLSRATEAIERYVARPLGLDVVAAASGIHDIANANMASAIRLVTVQRGIDPSDLAMCAFGGAGPIHAVRLAEEFNMQRVIVPALAGVMSAIGLIVSDVSLDFVQSTITDLDTADTTVLSQTLIELRSRAELAITAQGVPIDAVCITGSADLRYREQSSEMSIPLPPGPLSREALRALAEMFCAKYEKEYGIIREAPVEIVNLRVHVVGEVDRGRSSTPSPRTGVPRLAQNNRVRPVYLREIGDYSSVPVYLRSGLLRCDFVQGPAIVEDWDTSVVVPTGFALTVDDEMNLIIERSHRDANDSRRPQRLSASSASSRGGRP